MRRQLALALVFSGLLIVLDAPSRGIARQGAAMPCEAAAAQARRQLADAFQRSESLAARLEATNRGDRAITLDEARNAADGIRDSWVIAASHADVARAACR